MSLQQSVQELFSQAVFYNHPVFIEYINQSVYLHFERSFSDNLSVKRGYS